MARAFRNTANGHIEEVGAGQSIMAFLFCGPYLLIKGLWGHFAIVMLLTTPLAVAVALSARSAGAGFMMGLFASLIVGLIYAFSIQGILASRYLRSGWVEVREQRGGANAATESTTRKCPFCAEEILAAAKRCKHCHAEIEPQGAATPETPEDAAARLGIQKDGDKFAFMDYRYDRLEDAIAYASKNNER